MNRIPVWKSIRFAYTFAFGEIGTIIGLIWVPMVAIAVLEFLPTVLGTASPMAGEDAAKAGEVGAINLVLFFLTLLLHAMIYAIVTRQALGLRQGIASIHFSLGRGEWRMLSAILLCFVLVSAMAVALSAALALSNPILGPHPTAFAALFVMLYLAAGLGALLYASVRLIFLLFPVVVAEDKVDLLRAWKLSAGNFWRALAVIVAVTAPVVIVEAVSLAVIGGPGLFSPLGAGADFAKVFTDRVNSLDAHMPALIGLNLILAPFSIGLILGAASGAYRALVPSPARRT